MPNTGRCQKLGKVNTPVSTVNSCNGTPEVVAQDPAGTRFPPPPSLEVSVVNTCLSECNSVVPFLPPRLPTQVLKSLHGVYNTA